jgi:protein-S-isoprenylcysteine O-methyltransferase Ste14
MLFGVFVACLLLGIRSQWAAQGIVQEVLFIVGICLAAIGTLGRTWSNLFISGYKSACLIQTGPYSMCRNPLYLFSAIGMVGVGFCSGTLAIPLMMMVFFAIYYPMIIRCEESRLAQFHHDSFQEYCLKTPAFWPGILNYHEPETYTMFPRLMRKSMTDAFWFIVLAVLAHLVSVLHGMNALPALFQLW